MSTKLLDLVNITKSYDGVTILDDLNLYIRENEFLTLLSGCEIWNTVSRENHAV